jgi:hypothetical protein
MSPPPLAPFRVADFDREVAVRYCVESYAEHFARLRDDERSHAALRAVMREMRHVRCVSPNTAAQQVQRPGWTSARSGVPPLLLRASAGNYACADSISRVLHPCRVCNTTPLSLHPTKPSLAATAEGRVLDRSQASRCACDDPRCDQRCSPNLRANRVSERPAAYAGRA